MPYAICDSFDHSVACHSTCDEQGRTPTLFETEELANAAILQHDMDRAAAGMDPRELLAVPVRMRTTFYDPAIDDHKSCFLIDR